MRRTLQAFTRKDTSCDEITTHLTSQDVRLFKKEYENRPLAIHSWQYDLLIALTFSAPHAQNLHVTPILHTKWQRRQEFLCEAYKFKGFVR